MIASTQRSVWINICAVALIELLSIGAWAQQPIDMSHLALRDREFGWSQKSRSVTVAQHGMIATSEPKASIVGLDVLRNGGNAIDAAIAANAMLSVVEPFNCGLGGDLFAIVWDAKTQQLYGLNASGRSPLLLNRAVFESQKLTQIPTRGPLSWSVPGCASGWDALHSKFGSVPVDKLLQPAIQTAREGFAVSEIISGYWKSAEAELLKHPESAQTFLVNGQRAPQRGEIFRNPVYAETLERLSREGFASYYTGDIAKRIVGYSKTSRGSFTIEDFTLHKAEWVQPLSVNYRGYDVWELPPNGQGLAVLQMLNILKQFDLKSYGPNHPEFLHLFIEAKKLAYADRAKYYADPAFSKVPIPWLISDEYASQRAKLINPAHAAVDVAAGDQTIGQSDTIYLTVVDKDRNCCSLIQSTYLAFGSAMVPPNLGFALQNRGALFSLQPEHANALEPGKRPFQTIIPAFVTKDGKPYFSFGVMGGDMQPQGQTQVLVNMIDFGLDIQAAGDAARARHAGSATPTGIAAQEVGKVEVESGISVSSVKALEAKGHFVEQTKGAFGGYQGILIDHEHGTLQGASESRTDGVALGY